MTILAWIILGAIAGAITTIMERGREGPIGAILLGVGGAMVGGFIATALGFGDISGINVESIAVAVFGAVIVLAIWRALTGRRLTA